MDNPLKYFSFVSKVLMYMICIEVGLLFSSSRELIAQATTKGGDTLIIDRNDVNKEHTGDDLLVTIEEDAEFPGGKKAWDNWMLKINPNIAGRIKIPGKVLVYFEIDKYGKMINLKIIKGFNKECEDEVLRVMTEMQQVITWKPAKLDGHPGKVKRVVPFKFEPPK